MTSIRVAAEELFSEVPISERWRIGPLIRGGGHTVVRVATRVPEAPPGPLISRDVEKPHAAVKIISKGALMYSPTNAVREVFASRLLAIAGYSEHIVDVYEIFEDDNCVYIVMELLQGGELFDYICSACRYTEKRAANLVVSMLDGLNFCHRINITHRDIKPEHFVFSSETVDAGDSDLKIIDFGISHYTEDPDAMCKSLCGTLLYLAPEVLFRQPYGQEADMWSLGVIVFIMLVGYYPFDDADDHPEVVRKIKYQPPRWIEHDWQGMSPEARHFVSNLLEKDKSRRMTAAQALEHAWLRNNCFAASETRLDDVKDGIRQFAARTSV